MAAILLTPLAHPLRCSPSAARRPRGEGGGRRGGTESARVYGESHSRQSAVGLARSMPHARGRFGRERVKGRKLTQTRSERIPPKPCELKWDNLTPLGQP